MAQATVKADGSHARIRRIEGLDGLRAIAAGLVLVYHLIPGWAGIGYVGVDVFFVLSGFLITSLLLVRRTGLADFWARRFRRLFPATLLATIGSAALAVLVGGDAIVALGRQIVGSLTATYNWVEIANSSSYFNQTSPLLLTNMWSLALEQQFYLFWPIAVLVLIKAPRRWRLTAVLALAAGSTALHVVLVNVDVTRAYMGTDTHLWGLMFGAGLAFAMEGTVVDRGEPTESRRSKLWGLTGWLSLVTIIVAGLRVPNSSWMYPWGMVAASLLALLLIRSMLPDVQSAPAAALRRILDSRPLTWFGVRSYGIYMWHWPLYVLLYYRFPLMEPLIVAAIVLATSVLLADLSYRYVENPIRRMGVRTWLAYQRDRIASANPARASITVALPGIAVALALGGVIIAPAISSGQQAVEDGKNGGIEAMDVDGTDPGKGAERDPADTPTPTEPPQPPPEPVEPSPSASPEPEPEPRPVPQSWDEVTVIGDSVTLASKYAMEEAMPGIIVDAAESRSIKPAATLISQHAAQGTLGNFVVISLATNGSVTDSDIDQILEAAGPERTVVFVTAFGPARVTWVPGSNEAIRSAALRHPDRVRVADWNAAIAARIDLLAGDAVHPGREGAQMYAETVKQALSP